MMPTEDDVAAVRCLYTSLAAGDLARVETCFHPEAVWHVPGRSALAGSYNGWSAIRDELLARQGPLSGDTFRARLLDLAVGTEFIVAIVHAAADHAGRRLDLTVCQLMRVHAGQICEVRGHYGDEAALDAFWGPRPGGNRNNP
jgi:uncharacterized protein